MRDTVIKNKWLVMLLLALALAGLTKLIGSAGPAPEQPAATADAPPAPTATGTPDAQPTEVEDAADEDLIESGVGMDASGFDPSPVSETPAGEADERKDDVRMVEPEQPVGIDPSPVE